MPAVMAGLNASLKPRTSSSMHCRASTTLTLDPSIKPSSRSRHASFSPHPSASTVADAPATQSPSRQASGARLALAGCVLAMGRATEVTDAV